MRTSTILKWVTGGLEALLGIPVLGGLIILSTAWTPLFIMAILHVVTIVFAVRENETKAGNILGLITSLVGWIPFVGMVMHMISAVVILIDAYRSDRNAVHHTW
ncbi:hypothetical protein D1B31_21980 [Neobacillus notoginsengisoli]|uniref:Uncharacterized protein n=1 Tax=Neobacillus notoginsengisoli TaxID=1578198 RepID=A0A417YFI3_9BACI|nr:hypothetical protein [Neobacillus notoginsengisoli]RHW31480.1 hypothetical protein D1B31_21980 [Neobacillus notoginsengisoli]